MDKLIIISLLIGLIIVGGLAIFSIYLQQDKITVVIEPVAISTASTRSSQDSVNLENNEIEII